MAMTVALGMVVFSFAAYLAVKYYNDKLEKLENELEILRNAHNDLVSKTSNVIRNYDTIRNDLDKFVKITIENWSK